MGRLYRASGVNNDYAAVRAGFSFYEAEYEEPQPWLIVEARRMRGLSDKVEITPMLRVITKQLLRRGGREQHAPATFQFHVHLLGDFPCMAIVRIIFAACILAAPHAWAAQSIQATVNGMVCAFCAQGIEKKLRALTQTQDVYVNLGRKVVAVQIKEGATLSPDTVREVVKEAGYDVASIADGRQNDGADQGRDRETQVTERTPEVLRKATYAGYASLVTSSGTLVCCALPAALAALGAGAAMASLVAAFPALVWLSEHKLAVFAFAAVMLALAGGLQRRARAAPCPTDDAAAAACARTRRSSRQVYLVSLAIFALGAFFAFAAPVLAQARGP